MKASLFLALALLAYFGDAHQIAAAVEDDVKLDFKSACGAAEPWQVVHWLRDASARTVASQVGGHVIPGPLYAGRLNGSGPLVLRTVGMNDAGLYERNCSGRDPDRIELLVGFPYVVPVHVGRTAVLPCHSVTGGVSDPSAVWKKGGDVVLRVAGDVTPRDEFLRSPVSLPSDWMQRGDVSLEVERVEEPHGGDYFCLVRGDRSTRLAAVVRLVVSPRDTELLPSAPPVAGAHACWPTAVTTAVIFIVLTFLFTSLGCYLYERSRASKRKSRRASSRDQTGNDADKTKENSHFMMEIENGPSSSGPNVKRG